MSITVVGWLFSFTMAFNPVESLIRISYKEIKNYKHDVFHIKDRFRPMRTFNGDDLT